MKLNLLQPGGTYHVYNRARNGAPLFGDEEACRFFLRLYKAHITPIAETYAYCLLHDHLHLLFRIRPDAEGSLFKPFALLFNCYTSGYNRHNHHQGKIFRFKLKRAEIHSHTCFMDLLCYINQNPWRHGATEHPASYRFSSFRATLSKSPTMIEKELILARFGSAEYLENCLHSQVDEARIKKLILEE